MIKYVLSESLLLLHMAIDRHDVIYSLLLEALQPDATCIQVHLSMVAIGLFSYLSLLLVDDAKFVTFVDRVFVKFLDPLFNFAVVDSNHILHTQLFTTDPR